MRNRTRQPIPLIWLILVAVLIVMFAYATVEAQHQSNDMNAQTAGDVTTGSKNLAIGLGMGDVDIADCMYTKSTPLYQWGTINKWCAADAYDRKGQHDNAARMRCSIRVVRGMYESGAHCIILNTVQPATVVIEEAVVIVEHYDDDDDDAERRDHELRDEQIEELAEQLMQYGEQQQQVERRQQIQQQQYDRVQEFEETRQKKLDLIKREFGDDDNE